VGDCGPDVCCTGEKPLAGCCGHGDERSDFVEYGELLD